MERHKWYSILPAWLVLLLVCSVAACAEPTPPKCIVVGLTIVPPETRVGEPVRINAQVANVGGTKGTYSITLTLDGDKVQARAVEVAPGRTETISFTAVKDEPGTYDVKVNYMIGTFRVLKPAQFTISNLYISPQVAKVGDTVAVTADITNTGEIEGKHTASLTIDGRKVVIQELVVDPGVTETLRFTFTEDAIGSYSIEVGGSSGLLIVTENGDPLLALRAAYPELYQELLNLPDLKEMDERDNEAIEDIAYLALNPDNNAAFESMLDEGIKDKRKYCTLLEALLWIAYDREFDGYNPLREYSLEKLINESCKRTTTSVDHLESGWTSPPTRWEDFDEVVDRLNSPELISIYLIDNISYDFAELERLEKGLRARSASPRETFKSKKGVCNEHARFALYCLSKNGYPANATYLLSVQEKDNPVGHATCLYKENGMYYIIDTGTSMGIGGIEGPFCNIEEAAEATKSYWYRYRLCDANRNCTMWFYRR